MIMGGRVYQHPGVWLRQGCGMPFASPSILATSKSSAERLGTSEFGPTFRQISHMIPFILDWDTEESQTSQFTVHCTSIYHHASTNMDAYRYVYIYMYTCLHIHIFRFHINVYIYLYIHVCSYSFISHTVSGNGNVLRYFLNRMAHKTNANWMLAKVNCLTTILTNHKSYHRLLSPSVSPFILHLLSKGFVDGCQPGKRPHIFSTTDWYTTTDLWVLGMYYFFHLIDFGENCIHTPIYYVLNIYTNILWMYPRPTNSDSLRRDP